MTKSRGNRRGGNGGNAGNRGSLKRGLNLPAKNGNKCGKGRDNLPPRQTASPA